MFHDATFMRSAYSKDYARYRIESGHTAVRKLVKSLNVCEKAYSTPYVELDNSEIFFQSELLFACFFQSKRVCQCGNTQFNHESIKVESH